MTNDIHQQEIPPQDGMVYKVMSGQCDWRPFPSYETYDTVIKIDGTTFVTGGEAKPDKDDPIDYFMDWFKDVTDFEYRIGACLKDHGYLTEGDVAGAIALISPVENPFIYYFGDREAYLEDITDTLERELDILQNEIVDHHDDVSDSVHFKRVKALREALKDFKEYKDAD